MPTYKAADLEAGYYEAAHGAAKNPGSSTSPPESLRKSRLYGVRRRISIWNHNLINIYHVPRSAVGAPASDASLGHSLHDDDGGDNEWFPESDLEHPRPDRGLFVALYGSARLPAWLRSLLPQLAQFVASAMVDSAFPILREDVFSEYSLSHKLCPVVEVIPQLLAKVVSGYSSFRDFLVNEKHRIPIDVVYSIGHAVSHDKRFTKGKLCNLSTRLVFNAKALSCEWEDHADDVKLAGTFDFVIFCDTAYNLWKYIIDESPDCFTSFPQAPDICGIHVTKFFRNLAPHFNNANPSRMASITTLRHIVTDLFGDAVKVFRDAVYTDGLNTVAELDLMAGVLFCGKGNPAPWSTVARHVALFGIFRKITFIIQTTSTWGFLFSCCDIENVEANMKSFVKHADIDFGRLDTKKALIIIASRFCVVLERPNLLRNCRSMVKRPDMKSALKLSTLSRQCKHSHSYAGGTYVHSDYDRSARHTHADGTLYVPAKLRVSLILTVSMALSGLYMWLSIELAANDRFGKYVSLLLVLAGAVLGIGPGIIKRGWTYYDFVRCRMPVRKTSELGSDWYPAVLTVAKVYDIQLSGPYNGVFPDPYCSVRGTLEVDLPTRLRDVQGSDVAYNMDYDERLVVQLNEKRTKVYSNRINHLIRQDIEIDPLADVQTLKNLANRHKDILLA